MFQTHDVREGKRVRIFAAVLALLSLIALGITARIMSDLKREQEIVGRIIQDLPPRDLAVAEELSGDLRLQHALSALLVLNLIGTAIAFALVMQRYASSERSLRDVKVLATDILASMDAGVLTTDRQGAVTSINPRGIELLKTTESSIGRPISSFGEEHQLLGDVCSLVMRDHTGIRDRDYVVIDGNHKQTLRTSCTLLRDERQNELGTVIQVRDVSERVLIEERLRRMERYMGLGALASGLQHEIKNPLSALLLHIQLLAERISQQPSDPQVDELLDVIQTEVQRINRVLDGFRNYASVTELGRSEVNVESLVEKLVRLLRPQAETQKIEIKTEFQVRPQEQVPADSVGLEQVLLNLAINAMAAMPTGGQLTMRVTRQDDYLRIDVIDTGQGIAPEIQSQIFDPYFTTKNDGMGMGLALCDKIIRQHDGSLDFRTGPGGTEFSVLLPMEVKHETE